MNEPGFEIEVEFLFGLEKFQVLTLLASGGHSLHDKTPQEIYALKHRLVLDVIARLLGRYWSEDKRFMTDLGLGRRKAPGNVPRSEDEMDHCQWNFFEAKLVETDIELISRFEASEGEEGSGIFGVKVVSPMFPDEDYLKAMRLIERVMEKITQAPDYPRVNGPPFLAWINDSCDFRVTWRTGSKTVAFPLCVLKNLIAFWGLYEGELQEMQPPHHRSPRNTRTSSLWKSMEDESTEIDFLNAVHSQEDVPSLQDLIEPDRDEDDFSKIHLETRLGHIYTIAEGIQFREHAGTFNLREINFWLLFTSCAIVYFLRCSLEGGIVHLDEGEQKPALVDVMKEMGFSNQNVAHFRSQVDAHRLRSFQA